MYYFAVILGSQSFVEYYMGSLASASGPQASNPA